MRKRSRSRVTSRTLWLRKAANLKKPAITRRFMLPTTWSSCFSPNVTLRPVVQDYLLPTAAYIGGPAEIAYFAQLRAVYQTLERQEPCVLPRASFTIVEGRHQKTMKKYGLELQDFFDGLHPAVTKVVEQSLDRNT